MKIINFYNPCRQLEIGHLEDIWGDSSGKVIWCRDFNAHSIVWGIKDDNNGNIVEEFMEEKELVCLNDGTGKRIDIARGTESTVDITLAIAKKCRWEVRKERTMGSDHYPIIIHTEM